MSEQHFQEPIDVDAAPQEPEAVESPMSQNSEAEWRDFEAYLIGTFEPLFDFLADREAAFQCEAQKTWNRSDQYQLWYGAEYAKLKREFDALADRFFKTVLAFSGTADSVEARTRLLKAVLSYKDQPLHVMADTDQSLMGAGFDFYGATHNLLPLNRTRRLVSQVIEATNDLLPLNRTRGLVRQVIEDRGEMAAA